MHPAHILWLISQAPVEIADVQWAAPSECPNREVLVAGISRRLGRPLAAGEAKVDARVTGDKFRGYTLDLALSAGGRGETRRVQDPSCAALSEAAALRVVAAIEAPDVVPTPEPAPVQEPETAQEPTLEVVPAEAIKTSPMPEPAPGPEDRSSRGRAPGGLLRLQGGLELGALPGPRGVGPAGAVGLGLGLLWPRVRLELQGTVLAPRSDGVVKAGLYAGAVHGCGRLGRERLEVPLCLGLEVGALRASRPQVGANWWLAVVVGPGLAWHLSSRISVWGSLQLAVAPLRPVFTDGTGKDDPLFTPSVASGRLLVGVELRLRDRW